MSDNIKIMNTPAHIQEEINRVLAANPVLEAYTKNLQTIIQEQYNDLMTIREVAIDGMKIVNLDPDNMPENMKKWITRKAPGIITSLGVKLATGKLSLPSFDKLLPLIKKYHHGNR
jgi:hypothetical protein